VHEIELILALLVAVAVLALAAQRLRVPYPILLVLGGLVLALVPAVPRVVLAPELVFLLFLPPLVYIAGFTTSWREIHAQLRSILSLAVGLVLMTTAVVAVVAHAVMPELDWAICFALGAIVSPSDAVSATALLNGRGVPRRVVSLLEGESLFNDATAVVAYQAAIAAAATAVFSPTQATMRFVFALIGGVLVGLVVGTAVAMLRRRVNESSVEITISLLTPFAAYLAAEAVGVSGIVATVTAGLDVGWLAPRIMQSETRLRARAVWDLVVFVLNGLVFILIGLQVSTILSAPGSGRSLPSLVGMGAVITLAAIAARLVWVFATVYGHWLLVRLRHPDAQPPELGQTFLVGWAGMRGVVSLATALALPLWTPERDVLIFVTFCVILATLVGQGLTLPLICRAQGMDGEPAGERDEIRARAAASEAAVARIEQLAGEWPTHLPLIEALRAQYSHRASHLGEPEPDGDRAPLDGAAQQELIEHRKIRRAVIDAERQAVLDLRDRGAIDDQAWRKVERDLDLEELRMEA
jgi:CPA1 family monovalent cation:H+ antiporter